MTGKTKKPARAQTKTRSGQSGKKSAKGRTNPPPGQPQPAPNQGSAESRFVNDVLVRGEAAPLTPEGKLPLKATHILERENKDGTAVVRRARFKLF
jgi:hypothetical protein